MSGVAHTFPFRMRPGLGRVGEAWYGKAVTLWFELLQAGRWDLSSQTPAVSRAVRRSPGPGIGPLKPWEEGLPQDPPLVMTVNPRVDQRGRPDSQGKWGPSLPTTRWISGKLQGLTRTLPQPSCEAGALGDSPHLRQTSPPERRLLPRRDGIHRMAVGQSLQARALEGSPPCVESGGRPSGAPRRPTRTPAPARHPTPAASAGKPSVGARTWPSTGWCTRGRSPTRARSAARPSAGSPT